MDQCIVRAIQQELRKIESKLDNPRTGLAEIKSEVAAIECAVRDLDLEEILCQLKELDKKLEELLGAVDDVEDRLDDPHFGLLEIKEEVQRIEEAVACLNLVPILGLLNHVKQEVHQVECKLDDPEYGLAEIKEEVATIESAVLDPNSGLPQLAEEVADIQDILEDPQYGLAEIKREVRDIECKLEGLSNHQLLALLAAIKGIVLKIECKMDDPNSGLAEIKNEVRDIEDALDNPRYGLREIYDAVDDIAKALKELELEEVLALLGCIDAEIAQISCKLGDCGRPDHEILDALEAIRRILCNPETGLGEIKAEVAGALRLLNDPGAGLVEIKAEVRQILEAQRGSTLHLVSGPVIRGNGGNSLVIVVTNTDASTQEVLVEGSGLLPVQGQLPGSPQIIAVPPTESAAVIFELPAEITVFETRIHFAVPDSVTVFSAARTQAAADPLEGSVLLPENTIRNAEYKPL